MPVTMTLTFAFASMIRGQYPAIRNTCVKCESPVFDIAEVMSKIHVILFNVALL